jgi:glycosylphosphatidylinositol transamidase (GPIT) subunit GPI8
MDMELGVAVIDRFTYYNLEYLEGIKSNGFHAPSQRNATLKDLFSTYDPYKLHSHAGVLNPKPESPEHPTFHVDTARVIDFFGGVRAAAKIPSVNHVRLPPTADTQKLIVSSMDQPVFSTVQPSPCDYLVMSTLEATTSKWKAAFHFSAIFSMMGLMWLIGA